MTISILSIDCNKSFQGEKGRRNGNIITFAEYLCQRRIVELTNCHDTGGDL
jgi:hypothetical protein